ncbi:Omega-amidase NIT2, partial [Dissostichus eleginoides]
DERLLALEATCATLTDSNAKLLAKVTDLESRSRRNNIRIVSLPESIEGPHPSTFFPNLLMEVLGEGVLDSPP